MHTDSGMTGISPSGFMPYMTVASLEMSDEPILLFPHSFTQSIFYYLYGEIDKTTRDMEEWTTQEAVKQIPYDMKFSRTCSTPTSSS